MGFIAPPSGCNDTAGSVAPPGGSNVVSISYNTATEVLTVATDQPATYTTTVPKSFVLDNGDGTYTFNNQIDPPVTWNGSGLVQTVTGYWTDNTDPVNPIITAPKTNVTNVSPGVNDDSASGYSSNSWWFNTGRQAMWVCSSATVGSAVWLPVENIQIAGVAPVVGNDNTQGYFVGSTWFDSVAGIFYICLNPATGAANWVPINAPTVVSITATDPIVVTPSPITGVGVISAAIQVDSTMTGNGTVANPLHVVGSTLPFVVAVRIATTAALANTPVYNNGAGGVGATLTRTGNGAFPAIDGVTIGITDRILVKNQATQTENGIYSLTQVGGGGTPWILTRTTDSDATTELDNQIVSISEGTTQAGQLFSQTTLNPVVGTNNIVYALTNGLNVTQQATGTQVNRQIPWWTGVTRQLSRGVASFVFDASNKFSIGPAKFRVDSVDGDVELIKSIAYDWPAVQSVGIKLLTNDGAGNLTWSTSVYTNEDAQDAVGSILTDTNTINMTYNDAGNTITADVITQMSVDSDAGGVRLTNDLLAPGNLKLYGTSNIGVRGWYDQPGGVLNITYAALAALIAGGTVVKGTFYNITNATASTGSPFTNIVGLIVQGMTATSVSLQGSCGFYNADFQALGDYSGVAGFGAQKFQWTATAEAGYANGDVCIFNTRHYKVTNAGAIAGTSPAANAAAYTILAFSVTNGYIIEWDAILYDFTNDWISARNDKRGNDIREDFAYDTLYGFGINYIKFFQWGNNFCFNNKASDAAIFCLNNSGAIIGNQLQTIGQLNASNNTGLIADNTLYSESFITATNNAGQISANHLTNISNVDLNSQGASGTFSYNVVESQTFLTCTNNVSNIDNNYFSASTVDLTNNSGTFLKNRIEALSTLTGTNLTVNISNCVLNKGTVDVTTYTGYMDSVYINNGTLNLSASAAQFYYNTIVNCSSPLDFSASSGTVQFCEFKNNALISATNNAGAVTKCTFDACTIEWFSQTANANWNNTIVRPGSYVYAAANDGYYANSIFEQGCQIRGEFNFGFGMDGCRVSGPFNFITSPLDPNTLYSGYTMESGFNTFPGGVDITGSTAADMVGVPWAGTVILTSGNATETLDTLTNSPTTWPIKITPVNGLTVTINSQPAATGGATDFILENNTAVTMTVNQGTINDYLIVENVGFIAQTGGRIL